MFDVLRVWVGLWGPDRNREGPDRNREGPDRNREGPDPDRTRTGTGKDRNRTGPGPEPGRIERRRGPPRPGGSPDLPHPGLTHPAREIFQKFFCKIVELLHLRQRTILSVKIRLSFSTSYAARCPQPIIFCLKNLGKTALQGGFPLEFTVWWSWVITLHDTHEYPPYSPMSTLRITGEYPHL